MSKVTFNKATLSKFFKTNDKFEIPIPAALAELKRSINYLYDNPQSSPGSGIESAEININAAGEQSVDFSLATRLYDTITQNIIIGTLNNLTGVRYLDIDGNFTVDFSATLKADPNNEFYNADYLIPGQNLIMIIPKQAGGFIVQYLNGAEVDEIPIHGSDLATVITTGTGKAAWISPSYDITLKDLKADFTIENPDALFTIDVNVSGSTILSTKLTVDSGESSSETAATPVVISDPVIPARSIVTFDYDTAGNSAGKGLIFTLIAIH